MDDQEIETIFEGLSQMITQHKMDWVITQVSEQIRLGKIKDEEVKVLRHKRVTGRSPHPDRYMAELQPGPRESFLRTVEYSPKERLLLLVEAIEQAVANTAEMERELNVFYKRQGFSRFLFQPDEETRESFQISPDGIVFRESYVTELKQLLDELRAELH
jgi:hypothetical protein